MNKQPLAPGPVHCLILESHATASHIVRPNLTWTDQIYARRFWFGMRSTQRVKHCFEILIK